MTNIFEKAGRSSVDVRTMLISDGENNIFCRDMDCLFKFNLEEDKLMAKKSQQKVDDNAFSLAYLNGRLYGRYFRFQKSGSCPPYFIYDPATLEETPVSVYTSPESRYKLTYDKSKERNLRMSPIIADGTHLYFISIRPVPQGIFIPYFI